MPTIVSILSDQLIPNVLFIHKMSKPGDYHVFLTTDEMEGRHKSVILAGALGLSDGQFKVLCIDPHNPSLIIEKLKSASWLHPGQSYIVNITGGTKMMSQMVAAFFNSFPDAQVCYWPGSNDPIYQLFPTMATIPKEGAPELSLYEYLSSYGYSFSASTTLSQPTDRSEKLFQQVVHKHGAEFVHEIVAAKSQQYTKSDRQYLLGGWFEEWMYHQLKTILGLKNDQIAFNVKLKSRFATTNFESDNELDIAYIFNHKLYIWECKVYYGSNKSLGSNIRSSAYKLASIRQSLGLQAVSFAAILTPFGLSPQRRSGVSDLCRLLQIKHIWSLEGLKNRQDFVDELKQLM